MVTRRSFIASVAVTAVTSSISRAKEGPFPPGKYFDMHTHLGQTWNSTQVLTSEALLRWMDAHDISQAVILPLINPEASSYPLTP
ncbi:MAG: amidohydrolase, partial [Pirellulaceae bacterium]